jgi:predicted Zn-dependent peptidase
VVVVIGDFDPNDAANDVAENLDFSRTESPQRSRKTPPPPFPSTDTQAVQYLEPSLSEISVMVGFRVPPPSSPDYPAIEVANALLGGMKSGRLFSNIRDKQGLGYEVGSLLDDQMTSADLLAYAFASPTHTDPVTHKDVPVLASIKQQMLDEIHGMTTLPPSLADVQRAQHFLIGSAAIKHERIEDRTTLLGLAALEDFQGIAYDTDYARYIDAVTPADVQRVAAQYFVHPCLSIVAPGEPGQGIANE